MRRFLSMLPFVVAVLLLLAPGCGAGREKATEEDAKPTVAPVYPATLSADSTPSEVGKVLIEALEANDTATLLGLAAGKAGAAEFNAIVEKHGRKGTTTPEKAAKAAVGGWRLSYSFLQPNLTNVEREHVEGESAEVIAEGNLRSGKPTKLRIKLVREDGVWKVLPGLKTVW